jgi:TonB family protein
MPERRTRGPRKLEESARRAVRRRLLACVVSTCAALCARHGEGAPAPAGEAPSDAPPTTFQPPRLLHFVEAVPPASLGGRGEAEVVLTIDVDESGAVRSVEVARPAGGVNGAELDRAAVAAARQFVFSPGEADGRRVPVRITYSYRFVLKPAAAPNPAPAPTEATVPLGGQVLRRGDRTPVPGVAIIVAVGPGRERRAVTDASGRFTFEALPVGRYALAVRGSNIVDVDTTLTLNEGKRLELTTFVDVKERYASTVRGHRAVVETVEHTLATEEIKRIPGTQGDTLKAVQNLPGVSRAPFGIGLLPVWGSAPQDTRVYVDGVNVPLLYHFGGLRSTVNSEMVQSLTFVPGAYQAEHGLGLGGIVDVETRQPRADGWHGYAQMDLLDGSAMVEGPLSKTVTFAVAARRSWIDATLPLFTTSSLQLTPVYYDYQARLSWRPTPRDDVGLLLLGSDDRLRLVATIKDDALAATVDSHTYFHRAIATWSRRFARGATFSLTSSLGLDAPFGLGVAFGTVPTSIDQRAFGYATRAVVRLPLGASVRLDGGVDFEGSRFVLDRAGSVSVAVDPATAATGAGMGSGGLTGAGSDFTFDHLVLYSNHVAPFMSATLSALDRRLTITPQFRLQIMTFAGYLGSPSSFARAFVSPEPRLAVRERLSRRIALKGAAGLYAQPPEAASFSRAFGNPNLTPERGAQFVLGVELDVTSALRVEVDGFYKDLRGLVVPSDAATGPLLVNDGRGRAYGGELLARQELAKSFFGWLSYTLSRGEQRDHPGASWHPTQFDQTHILTVILSRLLPRGFQLGGRFRYVTGDPYTPVAGSFFDAGADRYTPLLGPPGSARLPSFEQLDLRVDKTFTFDRWRLSTFLDVQNVLRADNPEAFSYNFDFRVAHPLSGLPLLPIAGIRGDL